MTRDVRRYVVLSSVALVAATAATTSPAFAADTTPPTITGSVAPVPNGAGWNNSSVTVHFDCNDTDSGIASCTPDQNVSSEGVTVVVGEAVDNEANVANSSVTVRIDTTGPIVSLVGSGPQTGTGYYSGPVTVHATCADELSGIAVCPPDQVVAAEGLTNVNVIATDVAGNNTNAAIAIRIDSTGPTITPNFAGTLGSNGFYVSPVDISYTCNDAGSGVRKCEKPRRVANDGVVTFKASATDNLGRNTVIDVPVKVDRTKPSGKINSPARRGIAPGATITGSASDKTAGVASVTVTYDTGPAGAVALACQGGNKACTWSVAGPATPGNRTAFVTVTDLAGNVYVSPLTRFTVNP